MSLTLVIFLKGFFFFELKVYIYIQEYKTCIFRQRIQDFTLGGAFLDEGPGDQRVQDSAREGGW